MQHPGRFGEEKPPRWSNHEGGAQGRLAAGPRSGDGDINAGSGLLGSENRGGAIFEKRMATSCDGSNGSQAAQAGSGRPRERVRLDGRSNPSVRGARDVEMRTAKAGLVEHASPDASQRAATTKHTRESDSNPIHSSAPGGVTVNAQGILTRRRSGRRPTSPSSSGPVRERPKATV